VRHTRLDRSSIRTDGSRPTGYKDGITTPWVAASYAIQPDLMAYASWGKGVESQVVPNKSSQYSNAGEALPALASRQWEIGLKGGRDALSWQVAYFDIRRPVTNLDACNRLGIEPCEGTYDGSARHRGLEASAQWREGPWRLSGGVTLLDAKREGSQVEPAVNGQRPTNVPKQVVRAQAAYRIAAVPGLEVQGQLSHEGRRNVLPDGSIALPSWTRFDAALRYDTQWNGTRLTWTVAVENLFDKRYWKESPYQFGHVYLFPGAPRTLRLGLTAAL
jgi:iron complex outermembrane receptor protein